MDYDINSSDDEEDRSRGYPREVEMEVLAGDIPVAQMHVRGSISSLQRELQNLPNMPERPTIIVNHIYNIHHPSDRPSELHRRDVEAYGMECIRSLNRRCLGIIEKQPETNDCFVSPCLNVVEFFGGRTGIPRSSKYAPDPRYQNCPCREDSGEVIELKQLHEPIRNSTVCNHVAIIGNLGSGKSVLGKRYAKMVLNREIPELREVELVHYISVEEDIDCTAESQVPVRELLFDRFLQEYANENAQKCAYEYLCANAEKILFIFDGADSLLTLFKENPETLSRQSKTTFAVVFQNILKGTFFQECRTLTIARGWSFKGVIGCHRPRKTVLVKPLTSDKRSTLIKSVSESPRETIDMLSKFHASSHLTRDLIFLKFAISSLSKSNQNNVKISTDVMLVLSMLECLMRSSHAAKETVDCIRRFKHLAFDMVEKEVVSISSKDLEKYYVEDCRSSKEFCCKMRDFMVLAPCHRQPVYFRLLESDYSYFFSNPVFQELLAALYLCDMPQAEFDVFAESKIHLKKWLVVRKFLSGMVLNHDIRRCLRFCNNADLSGIEAKLLASLEQQVEKMQSLPSCEKLELLATLHECGQAVKSIIEKHIKGLVFSDIVLEPGDLYVLTRLGEYVSSLQDLHVCFDSKVSLEDYADFLLKFAKKTEKIKLDMTRLDLQPEHAEALSAPLANIKSTRQKAKHDIHLVIKKGMPLVLSGKFYSIQRSAQTCTIKIDEVA